MVQMVALVEEDRGMELVVLETHHLQLPHKETMVEPLTAQLLQVVGVVLLVQVTQTQQVRQVAMVAQGKLLQLQDHL